MVPRARVRDEVASAPQVPCAAGVEREPQLAAFVAPFGITAEDYDKAAKSFAVDTKIRRSTTMAQRYGVTGTPSVIINGKYLVTAKMAGGHAELIEVIEYLVGLEGAALQKRIETAAS